MRNNSGNILLIILVVAGILAASIGGYFWGTTSIKTPIIENVPAVKQLEACTTDNDCVIAIQVNSNCCRCPKVVSKGVLGKDGWETYSKGKDYNNQGCSNVACKPCEYLGFNPPVCSSGKCTQGNDPPTKTGEFTIDMCPKNGWLDCMPILTAESKRECDNIEWFKKNCSNFQGVTY